MSFRPQPLTIAPDQVRGVHVSIEPCNIEEEKTLHVDFSKNQIPMGHLNETQVRELHDYLSRTLSWFDHKKRGE